MKEINSQEFDDLKQEGFSFFYISAVWCGPCKVFSPIVSEVSEIYKEKVNFAKLDADQNSSKLDELGIKSLPTILIFNNGTEVERFSGLTTKQKLISAIENLTDSFSTNEDF